MHTSPAALWPRRQHPPTSDAFSCMYWVDGVVLLCWPSMRAVAARQGGVRCIAASAGFFVTGCTQKRPVSQHLNALTRSCACAHALHTHACQCGAGIHGGLHGGVRKPRAVADRR